MLAFFIFLNSPEEQITHGHSNGGRPHARRHLYHVRRHVPDEEHESGPRIKIRWGGFLLLHSPGSPVSARTVVAGWPLSPLSRIAIQWPHDYSLCEMVQRFTVQR